MVLKSSFTIAFLLLTVSWADPASAKWILRYQLTFDEALTTADAELCFTDSTPRLMVVPGKDSYLKGPVRIRAGGVLPKRSGGFDSRTLKAGDCVTYAVDLAQMAKEGGVDSARRFGDTLLVRNGPWLLQPAVEFDAGDIDATVVIKAPKGTFHLLPWPAVTGQANTYRLGPLAFVTHSQLAIGRTLELETVEAGHTRTHVGILGGTRRATRKGINAWVSSAVEAVASIYGGRFPADQLCVFAFPVIGLSAPVLHGYAQRGGGGHVLLYLNMMAKDDELPGEWVAIHELFHLAMPWVPESWLGEGMATWYGEVLRVRGGHLTERKFWEGLLDGFDRGRRTGTGRTLVDESKEMHKTRAYKRVYWGGAFYAMALDVALREGSGGAKTLDGAMVAVRKRFSHSRPVPGLELLAGIDDWYGKPLAVPMARRAMSATTFPDVAPLLKRLGISLVNGKIVLDDTAPLAHIRNALTVTIDRRTRARSTWSC
ncbi:MAG: hypothetical protein ACI9OJ_000644 [Myxococcota bacterium]|jgi:hypothetical protein